MNLKTYSFSIFVLLILLPFVGNSATYYCRANGNWTAASTWSTSSCAGSAATTIPGATDNVIICSGKTVTMNGTPGACLSLTVNGAANWTSTSATTNVGTGGLTLNNGASLTGTVSGSLQVAGTMIVTAGAAASIGNIILNVTGLTTINGTLGDNSTGGSNTFSNLDLNLTGKFNNTSAETYTITGNLNTYGGDFLATGATPVFNVAGNFNVVSGVCDVSRIKINVTGNTTISGTLDINSVRGTKTFNNFTVTSTGFFNCTVAENFKINGNILVDGAFNANNGVFTLGGASKTISGTTAMVFDDITCNGSYTNNGSVKVVTSLKGAGTWTQGTTGVADIGTTNANFSVNVFNASALGNTVIYSRANSQNIIIPSDGSYSNLTISGAGGNTKTLTGATTVGQTLLVSASTILATSNNNLFVGKNFSNNGTFTQGTATVTLNGTSAQQIDGSTSTAFNNLTISNSSAIVTAATNFSVGSVLSIAANAILSPNATVLVSGAGTLTGNGTARVTRIAATADFVSQYTIIGKTLSGLNVDFIGAGNQSVNTLNYGSLTISTNGSRTVTFPAAVVGVSNIFSPSSVTTNYVVTGNTINFNGSIAQTIPAFNYNHLTSSSSGSRTLASSGTIGIAGVFTPSVNTYTITGSTINFNGSTAQIVPAFNYYNLSSSSSGARTLAAAGTIGVAAVFTPGTNAYTVTNNTITFNGTIAQSIPAFTYNNLISAGSSAKSLSGNIIINNDITITSNLDVSASNYSITVKRNWINNGTFNAQNGAVVFSGAVAQTLSGTGTTTLNQLDINNSSGGVKLNSGSYVLNSVINPLNGNFDTNGQSFTMISNAAQTARIGQKAAAASLSGNFTIQRFITARDTTFADFSSTVQSSTINDWDNELPAISYVHTPPSALASAFTYNETSDVYVPITSSSTTLTTGKGYEVFLAGDFSYASLPNTTMNAVGVPNQGTQNLSSLISNNAQGWNLVGNPFASNISWASVYSASGSAASGLYDFIEMYDYTIGDWNGYTSADGIEIGSAQGFWVYGLPGATALTLTIPESAKTTTSNSSIKATATIQPFFTLKISNSLNTFAHTFKVDASFDANDGLDLKDIPFRASPNKATPALYSIVEGKPININTFNLANENYSMLLQTKAGFSGNYKIEAAGFDFMDQYLCIQLEDKLTHTFVNLKEQNSYSFDMKTTDSPNRFVLHFSKSGDCKQNFSDPLEHVDFSDNVEVSPTPSGSTINFSFDETTNVTIEVINVLGQTIVEPKSFVVSYSNEQILLPSGYSGMYIIKVQSEKGVVVKQFYKK